MPEMVCVHCGLAWPYPLMLDVKCPSCRNEGGAPGSPCRRPSEHPVMERDGSRIHFRRDAAALKAGAIVLCPPSHDRAEHLALTQEARARGGFPKVEPVSRCTPKRAKPTTRTTNPTVPDAASPSSKETPPSGSPREATGSTEDAPGFRVPKLEAFE